MITGSKCKTQEHDINQINKKPKCINDKYFQKNLENAQKNCEPRHNRREHQYFKTIRSCNEKQNWKIHQNWQDNQHWKVWHRQIHWQTPIQMQLSPKQQCK